MTRPGLLTLASKAAVIALAVVIIREPCPVEMHNLVRQQARSVRTGRNPFHTHLPPTTRNARGQEA